MKQRITVGIYEGQELKIVTEISPETPVQHSNNVSSFYARVRYNNKRLTARFIPDVNFNNGKLYKAFQVENDQLVPYCNSKVYNEMIFQTTD